MGKMASLIDDLLVGDVGLVSFMTKKYRILRIWGQGAFLMFYFAVWL